MRKKLVVRTLALLLAGMMVMEVPMQSYAAEAGEITVLSEPEDSDPEPVPLADPDEEPVNENEENVRPSLEIAATQFGTKPMEIDESKITGEWASIVEKVKTALNEKTDALFATSEALTTEKLSKIVTWLLEQTEDDRLENCNLLLPEIQYEAEDGLVTKVIFSYMESAPKLNSAAWEEGQIKLTYQIPSGTTAYELYFIPIDEQKKPKLDQTDRKAFTWETSGASTVTQDVIDDYWIMLVGKTDDKVTSYSNQVECLYTLPDVKNLTAETDFSGVTLKWDQLEQATGYTIYRKEKASEDAETLLTTIDAHSTVEYKDETVEADKTYTYKVTAYRSRGEDSTGKWESQNPPTVDVVSPKATFETVTINYTSPASGEAVLTWNAAAGAEGYVLYRYENEAYTEIGDLERNTELEWTLADLQVGTVYQYAVCPYKTVGTSRVYGAVSALVNVETNLAKVTAQAEPESYNKIRISWNAAAQAEGYEIYRDGSLLQTVDADTLFLVDTVVCGTSYTYKVRPFHGETAKIYGDFSTETSAAASLGASSMNRVVAFDEQTLDVFWKRTDGATGYELYRSTSEDAGYSMIQEITSGDTMAYRDRGLTIGTTYYYKVKAYRTENGTKIYGPESNVVSETVTLGTVTGVNAAATAYNTIQITWDKMQNATGYELYYSTSPDGDYTFLKKLGKNSVLYRWKRAVCGTTYYFQIRPIQKVKKVINYGSFSEAVSAKTTVGTVSPVIGKVSYDSLQLKWASVKGAKSYNVYQADSADGTYRFLMNTRKRSLIFKGLETGKTFYYKVSAVRDEYTSPQSQAVSGKTVMGALSGLKASSRSSSEIQLSWKKLKGAEKYVILRSTSAGGAYTEVGTTTKTSYVDKNLESATTYYYKVHAMRGSYKTNECGPVSAKTREKGSINTSDDKKKVYKGIDVSANQGTINWEKVASDDIDFAILRIVTGKRSSAVTYDTQFKTNYKNARAAGLDVGVYRYSYATTRTEARKEAKAVLQALEGKKLDYPIVMDYEDSSVLNETSSNAYRTEIILAFKEVIEEAGYKFALYANKNWLDNYIDVSALGKTDIWIARWRSLKYGHGYTGPGNVTMWQYTDSGKVKGISGNVDMDICYKKY